MERLSGRACIGRDFAATGSLMSYGTDLADGYRLTGNYAGRIAGFLTLRMLPV